MRPHGLQPTKLLRPLNSPGKNTGVGCHFLLQCMKVKSESEVTQSCPTLSDPMDCSLPRSSVHGIFQARVLEWGAIAFSMFSLRILHLLTRRMFTINLPLMLVTVSPCGRHYSAICRNWGVSSLLFLNQHQNCLLLISYDIPCMWNLKRSDTIELSYKTESDSQTSRRSFWLP